MFYIIVQATRSVPSSKETVYERVRDIQCSTFMNRFVKSCNDFIEIVGQKGVTISKKYVIK